jgi:hypothetical protein
MRKKSYERKNKENFAIFFFEMVCEKYSFSSTKFYCEDIKKKREENIYDDGKTG